ncbi:8-oxo-dGDP phosphatase NUDT18 isoform X1 [Dunckerocampus dactyliophorus]|uniref:8-oxo-dGDP phosphatase NUDT18 isoform X1 n=2 Tax=Dunckerocampus dactyliophorus TaxID=161453 RepID=UPI002405D772|nr:8-oxo-dGDP phosphatase NUDT18 isoform X1 [Dunckerocampus dactyliophorus]XP_054630002.1 8-oxo-dGDP phosphatase NUDT18 isoform X1 [Dunckerocampus dactyliophorus]XP_054630003.1 8-oxo-dGDP phosphatase NUDT18 isoform X1 [Dunckerocampus dactyliophorus]XP_054630004.1 8-oxo-dGDP phosphatase NUDT18 isoform X1 [Dunckerocampus dactyliophorus]
MEAELERVEEEMQRLLSGQGSEVTACDVGLEQSKPASLRNNVSYIVCAVIFNHKEEVLMVQEAKQDCYKKWYLPAGRVEVGESLQEALLREVKEEAGFECEPITLLLIQEQGPQWIRFIFLAKVTGGTIKSPSAADQESLQAAWWDRRTPLALRGQDILRLIEFGLKYHQDPWHPATLPTDLSCRHVVQRLVLVFITPEEQVWILLVKAPRPHLPVAAAVKTHAVSWASNMVAQDAMPLSYYEHNVNTLGVFSLQHNGRQHGKTDGVCFNTLVALEPDGARRDEDGLRLEPPSALRPPPVDNPRYLWHKVQRPTVRDALLDKSRKTSILPLHSLY